MIDCIEDTERKGKQIKNGKKKKKKLPTSYQVPFVVISKSMGLVF